MLARFSRSILKSTKLGLISSDKKMSIITTNNKYKEVEIKVPWGKLAGKVRYKLNLIFFFKLNNIK